MALIFRNLGLCDYQSTREDMQSFTERRTEQTDDEIWLLQHPPVFTQGLAGKPEHILNPGEIPVIQTERGGQVTYHGPGQLIAYILVDLKRRGWGVRRLVTELEICLIKLLSELDLEAESQPKAPGVYVDGSKIAALGLRIRRGCSFHGLALNVDMDLEPFSRINPCGYPDMMVTRISDLVVSEFYDIDSITDRLQRLLQNSLSEK